MARIVSRILELDELVLPPPPPLRLPPAATPSPLATALQGVPLAVWLGLLSFGLSLSAPVTIFLMVALAAWRGLSAFVVTGPPRPRAWQRVRRAGWDQLRPNLDLGETGRIGALGEIETIRRLAKLPDDYVLLHDLCVPTEFGSTQLDLVVLSPHGVWCLEVKAWAGRVFGQEDERQWTQVKYYGRTPVKDRRENPVAQNAYHCEALARHLRELGYDLPVGSLVVFTEAELRTRTETLVVPLPAVAKWLCAPHGEGLTAAQVNDLGHSLRPLVADPERETFSRVSAAVMATAVPLSHVRPPSPAPTTPATRRRLPTALRRVWWAATLLALIFIVAAFIAAVYFLTHLPLSATHKSGLPLPLQSLLPMAFLMVLAQALRGLTPRRRARR